VPRRRPLEPDERIERVPPVPRPNASTSRPWDRSDLVRRVRIALELAGEALALASRDAQSGATDAPAEAGASDSTRPAPVLSRDKVVAETAMLLLCTSPLRGLDMGVDGRLDALTRSLIAEARSGPVLAAICSDPGRAREYAVAHAILSRLGHLDPDVDRLMRQSLETAALVGPERLEHRRLELEWLERVWTSGAPRRRPERGLLARSMLGRPVDALAATRLDLYAFTHALMYATDLGTRRVALPRSRTAVCADAEAALAFALETDDLDLTAELCMTWPMLGRRWSPAAGFAFGILASVQDGRGFVPGIAFDPRRHEVLSKPERRRDALATSYHATYVMGFLCAIALANGLIPPAAVSPSRRSGGAGNLLLDLMESSGPRKRWTDAARALAPKAQDAIAPLILVATMRRARERGDIGLLRNALGIAVGHDLVRGPGPVQGAALLRRAATLHSIQSPGTNGDGEAVPSTDPRLRADPPAARPHRAAPAAHR
jgi:hypothetical protein